jgi:hypothetical protein
MKLTVDDWEKARAEVAALRVRQANDEGIVGAEVLDRALPLGVNYPNEGDPAVRRLAYALFGALAESTPWVDAALENSFTSFGVPLTIYAPPAYRLNPFGIVELRGAVARVSAALSTSIFTLPTALRPPYARKFVTVGNGGIALVQVSTNGQVFVIAAADASWYTNLFLDGISFDLRG